MHPAASAPATIAGSPPSLALRRRIRPARWEWEERRRTPYRASGYASSEDEVQNNYECKRQLTMRIDWDW